MTQNDQRMIYKTFDNPLRILLWTIDECCILFVLSFLGLILRSIFLFGSAFVLKAFYSHIKKKCKHKCISHFFYLYFPTSFCQNFGFFEGLPSSHIKEILLS